MYIRENRGITLIILIVTIITLLILAGVTISAITGGESTIDKASQAKLSTEAQAEMEEIQKKIDTAASKAIRYGNYSGSADVKTIQGELKNLVTDTSSITGVGPWRVTGTKTGTNYLIKQSYEVIPMPENTGTRAEMNVQVGDFVNYDAGVWTQEEIDKMGNLYSGETIPDENNPYTFGGFKSGQNKNVGIIKGENNEAIQDDEHAGWRVLKINDDGSVNIIHAGCPEFYFHPSGETTGIKTGFISQYILGNGKRNEVDDDFYDNIEKRNWSMYENVTFTKSNSGHAENFQESKQITSSEGKTDNSLRNLGFKYWLSSVLYQTGFLSGVPLRVVEINGLQSNVGESNKAYGIRPVITLKSECLFQNVNDKNTTTHNTQENAWNLVI